MSERKENVTLCYDHPNQLPTLDDTVTGLVTGNVTGHSCFITSCVTSRSTQHAYLELSNARGKVFQTL